MPDYWQVTKLRAEQSFAVWNLQPAFKVGTQTRTNLGTLLTGYEALVNDLNTKESAMITARSNMVEVLESLRVMAIKGAGKLSAELEDDDALDIALRQRVFSIDGSGSEADLIKRAEALLPIWRDYDLRIAPAAFTIRGLGATELEEALVDAYENAVDAGETAGTALSKARTFLEQHNRLVDRLIKKWYAAWKNEYPEGTPEGDALLAQVEAESGQQRPTKLEIASLTNVAGFKVQVAFVPGGGEHATLRFLQKKVIGVDGDFVTVRELTEADVAAGIQIGPFAAGQQVKVRTDVGNSRDPSEISAEASVVVA